MRSQHPNISSSAVRQGWHLILLAIILLFSGLSSGVQAAWESGAAGESTLAVSNGPNVLALAKSARVLAMGQDNKAGMALLNPDSGADIGSIPLSAKPIGLALSGDGSVIYALLQGSADVTVISATGSGQLKTVAIKANWPVGGKPVALLADQKQKRLYVADKEGRLLELNLDTGAVLRTLQVNGKPVRLALVSGLPFLLVGTQSGDILTVNLMTLAVIKTLSIGSQIDGLLWWDTDSLALFLPKNKDQWMLIDPVRTHPVLPDPSRSDPSLPDPSQSFIDTISAIEGSANRLAVDRQGSNAFIATQDDISVNLIDLKQSLNQGRHLLADKPGDVVFDPTAKVLYTSLPLGDKLLRLDPLQAKLAAPLSMLFRYRDVAVHQSQGQAYAVTERQNGLLSSWRLSNRFRSGLPLNAGARKIAIDPVSNLAVLGLTTPSDEIGFVDLLPSTPKLLAERIQMGAEILAIATDPARKRSLVLTDNPQGIRVLDNATRKQLAALNTTEVYRALAVHSGMGAAFLLSQNRHLATLDLASLSITSSLELDFEPGSIAVDESLGLVVISSPKENTLRVMDLNSMTFIRSVSLARHPGAVAIHPDFSQAVVASQESDLLSLVDLKDDKAAVQEFPGVPRPLALAIATSTNQAFVLSGEKDDLMFVDLPSPKPLLSAISPTEIASGSAAWVLKVQGSRFINKSSVLWGTTALTTRYVDPRNLEADVPATLVVAAGEIPVTVRNPLPGGGDSNSLTFTVKAQVPVLSSITPSTLKADSTDQIISLSGQYFLSGSYVLFNNQKISTTYVSDTKLDATVPGNQLALAGNATVAVFTPLGGTSSSLQVQIISIAPVLGISGINPDHGQPGAQIIITGTGFNPEAAKNTVTFAGDAVASITAATATQLTTVVPANAQSGAISVTNSLGVATWPLFTINRDQDLNLTASPASIGLLQDSSSALSIQLASSGSQNFIGLTRLSASGLPAGVTAKFEPAYLTASQPGVLRLKAEAGAATGTFPITLTAMANISGVDQPRTAIVNVNVQANSGVTGVKGRFVTPAGDGIADVRVSFDTKTTTTDSAGNFLLTGLPSGKVELRFDATEAHPLYPIWPNIVNLTVGQVRVYDDWIINPPPSDDKFKPIVTSSQAQSITDERYPGLAITIPAGVTIIGWDGVKKDRIAVERLNPDRLPVSPPPIATNSVYQLYFGTPMGGVPSAPIPVTLPNDIGLDPGEKTNLWYYDGSPMGGTGEWKVGGTGTASADGKVIVSDAGTGIPRFCGVCGLPCFEINQNKQPSTPPIPKGAAEPPALTCKPVRLATGQETPSETDLYVTSVVDLVVHRSFNPYDPFNKIAGTVLSLGLNWILNYDITLLNLSSSLVRLIEPGNVRTDFTPDVQGGFKTTKNSTYDGAVLKQEGTGWILTLSEGSQWHFARFGAVGLQYLVEQRDPAGKTLTILRRSDGRIQNVTSGLRTMQFNYGANGFVSSVVDDIGRKVQYAYNADNRIAQVTAPDGGVTSYTYQDDTSLPVTQTPTALPAVPTKSDVCLGLAPNPPLPYRIKTITNPGKTSPITMYYSKSGRVLRQVLEDGLELKFSYKLTGACAATVGGEYQVSGEDWAQNQAGQTITRPGVVVETTVTDALGNSNTQRFNNAGLATETVDSQGQKVLYTRDLNGRITTIKDTIGRTMRYAYDANGNRTRTTDPDGRFTDYTFDPKWNTIASVTQYMDNGDKVTRTLEYDPNTGRMLKGTDALGNATRYTYTSSGEVKTIADPLGNVVTLNYSPEGDLVSLKDPLGNTTTLIHDLAG
ncbi:IPT/TIG domain-containing protein, partial [Candidatus Nitrotoga sp. 1052]|uniref:IPT/TIG domain-containing protein n=1 Tax=Candidatus Nitrotoga sp. 1052 TaxID=2886964 RepID=UPI001EF6A88D